MQHREIETRAELLYNALEDIQQTVRAFDIKAEALILGMALPFANIHDVTAIFRDVLDRTTGATHAIATFLVIAVGICGGASLLYSVRVLTGVNDPAERVRSDAPPQGAFFTGRYYRLGLLDTIFGGKKRSAVTLEQHLELLPTTGPEIERQLAYEHMKIGYIVARKMVLFNLGLRLFVASGACAAALGVLHTIR